MSSFTDPLIVRHLDGRRWQVMKEFSYHVGSEDSDEVITVPVGFITDFASIPRLFWSLIGAPTGKYGKAAVIHDYLYYTCGLNTQYTRAKCDYIFYEAMQVLGIPFWKRWLMYHSVKMFAWIPWKKYCK